jgi:hypothetical protein
MSDNKPGSGGLSARLPWSVKLGVGLISMVYAVAILTDTITDPITSEIPSDVWAVVWFAVAFGPFVRAVRLYKQP